MFFCIFSKNMYVTKYRTIKCNKSKPLMQPKITTIFLQKLLKKVALYCFCKKLWFGFIFEFIKKFRSNIRSNFFELNILIFRIFIIEYRIRKSNKLVFEFFCSSLRNTTQNVYEMKVHKYEMKRIFNKSILNLTLHIWNTKINWMKIY